MYMRMHLPSVSIGPRKRPMFANRAVLDFPTASGLDLEKSALNWARLGLEIWKFWQIAFLLLKSA